MKKRILALAMASVLLLGYMRTPVAAETVDNTVVDPDMDATEATDCTVSTEASTAWDVTIAQAEENSDVDETNDVSAIVDPFSVEKPEFVSGSDNVPDGGTYTFSYADTTNYTYSDLKITMGGTEVIPAEADGMYILENVTGTVVITVTQIPNSYEVTKHGCVEGPEKAVYGVDYVFSVASDKEATAIDSLKIAQEDGTEISYTILENGEYVIKGTDIAGAFAITVIEQTEMTTLTFQGIEESEIEGGLSQTAEVGKAFNFRLIKVEGCDYTVRVGEFALEEQDGIYMISAELVGKEPVTVNIEKLDTNVARVDVYEYINLNGRIMFLIAARWGDSLLAYGEESMFYSEKYTVTGEEKAGAYCWLVVSTDEINTVDQVKAAAERTIVEAAEDTNATSLTYDCDINGTARVDVNDAQLAYDMYNASYMEFTETLPMRKFLEADLDGSMNLGIQDVVAITNCIVKQNA